MYIIAYTRKETGLFARTLTWQVRGACQRATFSIIGLDSFPNDICMYNSLSIQVN